MLISGCLRFKKGKKRKKDMKNEREGGKKQAEKTI
jgi:hypothetical protein